MISPPRILPVAVVAVAIVAAAAQTPPPVDTVAALPGPTVRADHLPRTLGQVPAAVSRVGPAALARELALTPVDALNRVPGVTYQQGGLGTQRLVIRGQGARAPFTSNRVRAYLGAIPLTDGEGATDLEDVDLALLAGVDVVRGPAATAYGSGLGGVVLLRPDFDRDTAAPVELEGTAGRFGTYRAGLRVSAPLGEGEGAGALSLGYRRTQSAGFRQNGRYRRDNLTALLRLGRAPDRRTDLQLLWTGVRNEIASALGASALADDPTRAGGAWGDAEGLEAYDRLGFGVSHTHALPGRWTAEASAFLASRRADEPRPFNVLRERSVATGGRAVLRYDGPGEVLRAAVGGEAFRDWYDGATYANLFRDFPAGTGSVRGAELSDQAQARTQLNAFGQVDLALGAVVNGPLAEALALTLGLGVNQTRYRLEEYAPVAPDTVGAATDYGYGAIASPRVALSADLGAGWTAFAQAGRGFSAPSVAETLAPDGRINPDIAPETAWVVELGARAAPADGRWRVAAVGYRMGSRDLLVARRTAEDAFVGVNAGETRHLGLEVEADATLGARPAAGGGPGARAYLAYALQAHRFEDFVDGDADFSGNRLTGVPRHSGAAGADVWWGRAWTGHVGVLGRGSLPVDDAGTTSTDSYAVVNARLTRALAVAGAWVALTAGLDNALDADYVSMVSVNARGFGGSEPRTFYPGRPRTWYVGAVVSAPPSRRR